MSDALKRMAKGGKTFYFASLWLDSTVRREAAIAYSFCRTVDDIADNLPNGEQRTRELNRLLDAICSHRPNNSNTAEMLGLIERYPQIQEPLEELIRTCASDIPGVTIRTPLELLQYAHGVAGTVGLIMYPLLGGTAPEGLSFAADLGIAMQCTNIARDIIGDLQQDRVYLPREWLQGLDPRNLLVYEPEVENVVVAAVRRLLALADEYYTRGLHGLSYLHPRCRFAIRVAATCYAAIGSRVIHDDLLVRHRAVVPLSTKVMLMLRASRQHRYQQVSPLAEAIR